MHCCVDVEETAAAALKCPFHKWTTPLLCLQFKSEPWRQLLGTLPNSGNVMVPELDGMFLPVRGQ